MRFKRIFITGGTGYIGKSLLDYRLRHPDLLAGAELVLLARDPMAFKTRYPRLARQPGVSFIKGDVRSFEPPSGVFDAVVSAASPVQGAAPDDEITEVNIEGTRRLIQLADKMGVQRILMTSSGAVYGRCMNPPDEDSALKPLTAYGVAKMKAERMLVDSGISTGIARIFAEIGPYLPRLGGFAVGNFIQNCINKEPITIKGDGRAYRSYLFADDLIEWLSAILECDDGSRAYNVGSPHGITILDLARTVSRICGWGGDICVLGRNDGSPPERYYPNVCRAMDELAVKIHFDLEAAIEKTYKMICSEAFFHKQQQK